MVVSHSSDYAISAMLYLAEQPTGSVCSAQEISSETGVHLPYLFKVLKGLRNARLVRSSKGVKGGYKLAPPAIRIRLNDIIDAVSDTNPFDGCFLSHTNCGQQHPCGLHEAWESFRTRLYKATLPDLKRN